MRIFHRRRGGRRLQRKPEREHGPGVRLAAFLLCLSVLAGLLPALALAEDTDEKLSDIVHFESITLHSPGSGSQPVGDEIQDGAYIGRDALLVLRYTYTIDAALCGKIQAGTNYYLEVSPHLILPNLGGGSDLTFEPQGGEKRRFGTINADGKNAWVTFDAMDGGGTVLSDIFKEYDELKNAYFYLNCTRAGAPPAGEQPDGQSGLYAMKFENGRQLRFGYAEDQPVMKKAQVEKSGSLKDQIITWTVLYTPWQTPSEKDGVTLETPFELRDTIDSSQHSLIENSVTAGGVPVTVYDSRDKIPQDAELYAFAETQDGRTTLAFGGTRFNAVKATQSHPAQPLEITYQTSVRDALLLPGGPDGQKVSNAAELFARDGDAFTSMKIIGSCTVPVPQPLWLTKTGKTVRHTDGTGSTTDWTVTFLPNGFAFDSGSGLTLHDQLPQYSSLVEDSVKVNGTPMAAAAGTKNDFTVSGIETDSRPVTITYQTHVEEDTYENGLNLGANTAWFMFQYDGQTYETKPAVKDVGSGDGSETPGTARLVKTNSGYNAAERTVIWTVKINPHQANLQGGTFTDSLKTGSPCEVAGHTGGLELKDGINGITVQVNGKDPTDAERALIDLQYKQQELTITVGAIGSKAITLTYATKVCDPCIFASNTKGVSFTNTISTENMKIGNSGEERKDSASSPVLVSAAVLVKKPPVYDYAAGVMKWEVEVNGAGLPMTGVVLTDELPEGLTFLEGSLAASAASGQPAAASGPPAVSAKAEGQLLTIDLGSVTEKTTVTFDTKTNPELLGFGGGKAVEVKNTVCMNGTADGVPFEEVSYEVSKTFSNHGLVKRSTKVDNTQEFIQYEVLINPFGLVLPEKPFLEDTLDSRLQLDGDTLRFYRAELSGTSAGSTDQRPGYTKEGSGEALKVTGFDPAANRFTVQLPIAGGSRDAYVLAYTADIMDYQAGGYSNSVCFRGGSLLLGGEKTNSTSVGGGGGGGGGGAAARKAAIALAKTDSETQAPLEGVTFTLYEWDGGRRGLPAAQRTTDAQGKLSFRVKPNAVYELVETESAPGYGSAMSWEDLPAGVTETDSGLLITAGGAGTELALKLANEAHTTDLVFRLVNESGIPMAGSSVQLFTEDPAGEQAPDPRTEVIAADGTVLFRSVRRGAAYYIRLPGGEIMMVNVPAQPDRAPSVTLPDGSSAALTEDYQLTGSGSPDQEWTLTVRKVISGGTEPLRGAVIGLYAGPACQDPIKTGQSGQDGTILFSGLIRGQHYWIKEIQAPSGYELDSSAYEADETAPSVTVANTPTAPPVNPEEPGGPTGPTDPADPPDPGNPGVPGGSGTSGRPSTSGRPAVPAASIEPGMPGEPETAGEPGTSGEPGTASESGTSGEPGTTGEPGTSGESGGLEDRGGGMEPSGYDPNIPQTGDDTGYLTALTLFSGILLAAMTLCQWLSRKRSKNPHS